MANTHYVRATKAWIESIKQHVSSLERANAFDSEEIIHLNKMICLRNEQIAHFDAGIEEAERDLQNLTYEHSRSNTVS